MEDNNTSPKITMEIKDIIKYIYNKLDYNIIDFVGRNKIILEIQDKVGEQLNAHLHFCIINNLNNYKIASSLNSINNINEMLTEYLLNAKDVERDSEYKYYSPDKLNNGSSKNMISLETYMSDVLSVDGNIYKHYDDINCATYRIENFAKDMQDCNFIEDYITYNEYCRYIIENNQDNKYTEKEISIIKKAIGYCKNNSIEIDKDIIALYKAYKGFIYFKQPLKETTIPSYEYFDFSDINHVMALLKFKGAGNFDSDLGCLLYDLNQLINKTKLSNSDKYIIDMYRNNDTTLDDIAKEFNVTKQNISNRLQNICKRISKQYWIEFEDWYYTFIAKGSYKKCSCCGKVKLANDTNFSPDKRNKDGFHSICKGCRREYVKNR